MTRPEDENSFNWWVTPGERAESGLNPQVLINANAVFMNLAADTGGVPLEFHDDIQALSDQVGYMVLPDMVAAEPSPSSDGQYPAKVYEDALIVFDYLNEQGTQNPLYPSQPLKSDVDQELLRAVDAELTDRFVMRERAERAAYIEQQVSDHTKFWGRVHEWAGFMESNEYGTHTLQVPRSKTSLIRNVGQVEKVYKRDNFNSVNVSEGKTLYIVGDIDGANVQGEDTSLIVLGKVGHVEVYDRAKIEVVGKLNRATLGRDTNAKVIGDVDSDLVRYAGFQGGSLTVHGRVGGKLSRKTFTRAPQTN